LIQDYSGKEKDKYFLRLRIQVTNVTKRKAEKILPLFYFYLTHSRNRFFLSISIRARANALHIPKPSFQAKGVGGLQGGKGGGVEAIISLSSSFDYVPGWAFTKLLTEIRKLFVTVSLDILRL